MTVQATFEALRRFLVAERRGVPGPLSMVSLFSSTGLSDLGYEAAGFDVKVQVEADETRASVGRLNFPDSRWVVGDVRDALRDVVREYREEAGDQPADLLVATAPCSGLSSINPGRGNRADGGPSAEMDARNRLILEIPHYARALRARIVVAENVSSVLTYPVEYEGEKRPILDALRLLMPEYEVFSTVVDVADYGVPQRRRRAIVVAIRRDEPVLQRVRDGELSPWPEATHAAAPRDGGEAHLTVYQWLRGMRYRPLDASCEGRATSKDPLHAVPVYDGERYRLVAGIPPMSGASAWQNDECPGCAFSPVPRSAAECPSCGSAMTNRPLVWEKEGPRLVVGFHSSYKRMHPDRPAPTVTTNSNRLSGAYKIHPWENRVLSARECSDLQTVPRFYDWGKALERGWTGVVREFVGDALPPYFAYLHGLTIANLLFRSL